MTNREVFIGVLLVGILSGCETVSQKQYEDDVAAIKRSAQVAEHTATQTIRERDARIKSLNDRIESLNVKVSKLEAEAEELRNGAPRLLEIARVHSSNGDFERSLATLLLLQEKHPESVEWKNEGIALRTSIRKKAEEMKAASAKAELDRKKAEELRIATATKKMSAKSDDINDVTWYADATSPIYINKPAFYVYFSKSKVGLSRLRLRIQYTGKSLLKISKYTIKADSKLYEIYVTDAWMVRSEDPGNPWESYDTDWIKDGTSVSIHELASEIMTARRVILRSEGYAFYEDREIGVEEKQAFRNVLDAYGALGGARQ